MAIGTPNSPLNPQNGPPPDPQPTLIDQTLAKDEKEDNPPPGAPVLTRAEAIQVYTAMLRIAKEKLVSYAIMQQWEADHLFEPLFKHLGSA